jgi:hypothetical protein
MPRQPVMPWSQDPLDRIAVQVMTAEQPPYCAKMQLPVGPKGLIYGCIATIGDTTLYFYQDYHLGWMGPILIAGRMWKIRAEIASAVDEALQTQLNHVYGSSRDCVGPRQQEHMRYHRWDASSFMVLLEEGRAATVTGPWTGEVGFWLQYVKAPVSCASWDALNRGPRPLLERENHSP